MSSFLPPGVGVVKSKTGLPDSEVTNTFGILSGASDAVEALGGRIVVDSTFVESTAFGQVVELKMKKQEFGIFTTARILTFRIRVRAISIGVVASKLRAEVIVNGISNEGAFVDLTIATGSFVDYTTLIPGKEVGSGVIQAIEVADLSNVAVRLTSQDGANPVRISKVEVEVLFLPEVTDKNFFNQSPISAGWTELGDIDPTFRGNILKLRDNSSTKFFQFSKLITPLTEFGVAATIIDTTGVWVTNVGVYSYTALSVDIGTEYFQVNLLEDAQEKIGLLKGQPSSFDPTLIGSYEDSADFDWDDSQIHLIWIEWDETTVKVFTELDIFNPILQAPRANIGVGTGSPAIEFGTAVDIPTRSSRGEIVVFSFDHRGFQSGN